MKRKFEPVTKVFIVVVVGFSMLLLTGGQSLSQTASPPSAQGGQGKSAPLSDPRMPRGKKLILKDGSFQLVREYQLAGDRVRYYSLDQSQWEEIPADLVDWDATKKVEAQETQRDAAVVAQEKARETQRGAELLDIDASVEAAPGVFLPPGQGVFAFDGKSVFKLAQIGTSSKIAKGKVVEQVLVPIPIIPTRHNITIARRHSEYRVTSGRPEFYVRTTDPGEPELDLVRATVHGDSRQIEKLDQLFGAHRFEADTVPMERWEIARGLYRFTLAKTLEPGEYALVEIAEDANMSLYVWDFGVDADHGTANLTPK